jgi:hypothetical protein
LPDVAQQELEQLKLARLQVDRLAGTAHLAAQQVHLEVAGSKHGRGCIAAGLRAPRERLEASEQLAERERLDEVVVAAGFEPFDAIVDLPSALKIKTGVVFADARGARITVRPSIPGSMRSTTSAS